MRSHQFHPWRRLRDLGPSWTLEFSHHLPEAVYGWTDFRRRTITLREGLSFEERRCTITHEVEHARRGPASSCAVMAEELEVDRIASRLLLSSIRDVADTLIYHHGNYEAVAADLWVDVWMLEVRMSALRPDERAYLDHRLSDVILTHPAGE